MTKKRIIVIGAGFAGITALQKLDRSGIFDITLISPKGHFEYYPGLYRVIGDRVPFEVFVPFRYLLPQTAAFIQDTVTSIDVFKKEVETTNHGIVAYDTLIVATGMVSSDFGISGVSSYANFVTSLAQACQAKKFLIEKIQAHIALRGKTSFVVVIAGAGPTGIELAGELSSFFRALAKTYRVPRSMFKIQIIQRDADILPQLDVQVRQVAQKRLRALRIETLLSHTITSVEENAVLTDKGSVPFSFFFWTAGATQPPIISGTKEFTLSPRKKVVVDGEFRTQGIEDVYVVGDNAETQFSGLAQIAEQDGAFVGNMLVSKQLHKPYKPYTPRKPIFVIPIGDYFGILGIKGKIFTGIIPWILRYAVDMRFFFFRLKFADFISLSIERKLR